MSCLYTKLSNLICVFQPFYFSYFYLVRKIGEICLDNIAFVMAAFKNTTMYEIFYVEKSKKKNNYIVLVPIKLVRVKLHLVWNGVIKHANKISKYMKP